MNNTMKRILLATDGSEFSEGAKQLAIALASHCGSELHIMTIVLAPVGLGLESLGTYNLRESLEKDATDRLEAAIQAAQHAGLQPVSHLAYGESPEQEIINVANSLEADLIVLGRRGKRGLDRGGVGHATAYVAGQASCSVLVVPRASQMWQSRILVATDGSAHGDAAVAMAKQVAGQCGVAVTVTSAVSSSHNDERKAEARRAVNGAVAELNALGVDAEGLVLNGRPDEMVVATAVEKKAELILVGSRGRTGISKLLLGSISERIIGQAACPVLVARA